MKEHNNITYNHLKTFIVRNANSNSAYTELYVFDSNIGNETFEITSSQTYTTDGWHHVLVRPTLSQTPSYEAMAEISDALFQDEFSMQIIPRRENYISKEKYTLHLWNMKSPCNFDFLEAYNYLFQEFDFDFKDGICVQLSSDTVSHKCIAVIAERRFPSWEELVQAKEKFMGTQVDAVIINRNLEDDLVLFEKCKYKIVLIWDASSIKLPDKSLV